MKFEVTPELALLIRTLQTQSGLSSKELAGIIGKSPSYVTNLEKGNIKKIQKEDLTQILSLVTEGDDFFEDKLPQMIRTLSSIASPDALLNQGWLLQYDSYDRPITISPEMAQDIRRRMEKLSLDADRLSETINANKDVRDRDKLPTNEIVLMQRQDGRLFRLKASVDSQQIRNIIGQTDLRTNYGTLYSIMFILIKLDKYGDIGFMQPPQAIEVLQETGRYLASWQVFSLTHYGQFMTSDEFLKRQQQLLGPFDAGGLDTLPQIMDILRDLAEIDNIMTQTAGLAFLENLNWDPAFMLKLISLPFGQLKDLSHSNKAKLLEEISGLLETYHNMSDLQKKIENY